LRRDAATTIESFPCLVHRLEVRPRRNTIRSAAPQNRLSPYIGNDIGVLYLRSRVMNNVKTCTLMLELKTYYSKKLSCLIASSTSSGCAVFGGCVGWQQVRVVAGT
jgi:hypothetical protein